MSAALVRDGATALERLAPEELFPSDEGEEEWYRENYEALRQLYLEAAERDQEVLIGVA